MIKNHIIYNNFCEYSFDISKANDCYVWDQNYRKMIDFTSGWNVTNLGWNNKEIANAMIKQIKKNTYAPMWTADPIQNELTKELANALPKELNCFGRTTGGTESNEEAIKTARAYTERKKIIGFKDTYHGQSYATLALGYPPEYTVSKSIAPMLKGYVLMDFPDKNSSKDSLQSFAEKLELILKNKDVAAIVTEAGIITGWGSTLIAPKGYLTTIRQLTKQYGTLLILDEVGTGFSRCGKLFGMQLENITPDIVTFAKGMCNGAAAIGTMVTTQKIAEATFAKSNLTSTFGWTPVACAAALKTLQIHKRDKVWLKSDTDGKYLLQTLKNELRNISAIEYVDGIGMEVGVHFRKIKNQASLTRKIIAKAHQNGLHLAYSNDYNQQIMPPLTIERKVLDKGIDILIDVVESFE